MLVTMILTISVMFLSVMPSASPSPAGSPDDWTKTYNLERTPKLHVETSDANIHVTSCDCSTVVANVTTVGWKIGGDGINIIDRQNGAQIAMGLRFPRTTFQMNWRNRRVDIELKVPREADLDLR